MIYKLQKSEKFFNIIIDNLFKKEQRIFITILNGKDMEDEKSFYKEFGIKLNFPDYYGQNYNALLECLTDLDWIEADKLIIIIKNFNYILKEYTDEQKEILDNILKDLKEIDDFWNLDMDPYNKTNLDLKVDFYLVEN